jgi:hypothetical protein
MDQSSGSTNASHTVEFSGQWCKLQMMLYKSSKFISNQAILFSRLIVVVGALVDATG